ncbi:hypothetical protein MYE70_14950 [Marinobacter alexandrii]|uniref:hypothetical protein n=1 Tax=Marinobacter alexandrii TaxID=2570351 RepID=UPI001FFE504C|nr:hypothetical protein [Marinobacter alexandrii]MCK2150357.1 hypothetical protein [Marinobacter alexandrii]
MAIDSLEDLANQKVRMGGPIQKRLLEELGAIPVAAPATKAYELLEGRVLDASLHTLESVVNFRLTEQLPHHTEIPGGFYDATFFLAINKRKWKKLSEEDRNAIMSVSGEVFSSLWGKEFQRQIDQAELELQAAGHSFNTPSSALLEKIAEIRERMIEDWASEGDAFGVSKPLEIVEFHQNRYQELSGK